MKTPRFILALAIGASALAASHASFGAEPEAPEAADKATIQNYDSELWTRKLTEYRKAVRVAGSNVHIKLEITSNGKTTSSSGTVINGSPFSLRSLEKREYISSVSFIDGIKSDETKGTLTLGDEIEVIPQIQVDGKITATVSFSRTVPIPGTKQLAPLFYQPNSYQGLHQTLTLTNGVPLAMANLSTPEGGKDLSVTITATIEE